MKADRGGWRPMRREQLLQGFIQDSYKAKRKLPEPTRCPTCGAVYRAGRWTWDKAPAGTNEAMCPACHRIHDHFPGGYLTISGSFFREHRGEILNRVRNCEEREKAEHPLERIMGIEEGEDRALVTTTSVHLARLISEALHDSFKGQLDFSYNREENLLRATWSRAE